MHYILCFGAGLGFTVSISVIMIAIILSLEWIAGKLSRLLDYIPFIKTVILVLMSTCAASALIWALTEFGCQLLGHKG